MKKALALILMLCMVVALCGFSAEPSKGGFAQVDDTTWAGDSITIKSVEIAEEYADYVDATLFCNVEKIVYDGGEIDVDSEKYVAVLTVDGVQRDLYNAENVTYEGDVVISLIEKAKSSSSGNSKFGDDAGSLIGPFFYTAAAYYDEEGYHPESSVIAAQGGAKVDDKGVSGMNFDSQGDYFSAVYANGGEVAISDSSFIAFGKGGDDFTGQGCAVVASGEAVMSIDNCVFDTEGALRSAIWAGGSAIVDVTNTVVQSRNDTELVPYTTEDNYATSMMQQVPFALGLTGNIRATLDCGQADIFFTDSLIASDGWAVLSTDSGSGMLDARDTVAVLGYVEPVEAGKDYDETFSVSGVEYGITYGRVGDLSGYIAYCDGFTDYAYGGRWIAPDYLAIITGGSVTVGASEKGRFYGWSDRIGFMSHKTTVKALLDVSESDFDITDTFAIIKSTGGNGETINLTDVSINLTGSNPWGGNLLMVMDTDDLGGGPGATTFVVPYGDYDAYLSAGNSGAGGQTLMTVTDSQLKGNVFNSVGSMNGTSFKADAIDLVLNDASLEGIVSSAYAAHCDDEGTLLIGDITVDSYGREGTYDYLSIGRLMQFAAPTVNNPVTLTLNASDWTCTGLSYLKSLTLDKDSSVDGDIYVGGEKVKAEAGTYEDVIVVPAGAKLDEAVAAAVAAIEDATAAGIVPADRSELVANVDMGGSGEPSGEASEEPASEETAPADEPYPFYAEYQAYVGEKIMADDFMSTMGAYEDAMAATNPYGIPYVDVNSVIGALDYPDWMAANHPGVAFSES